MTPVAGPVKHTGARHIALATIGDGSVRYSPAAAQWTVQRTNGGRDVLTGSTQRTMRDLIDLGLAERHEPRFDDVQGSQTVELTRRGHAALALWGRTEKRL